MAKFNVKFYYRTNVTVEVEAENEKEALANAQIEVEDEKYDKAILRGIVEDSSPDVKPV